MKKVYIVIINYKGDKDTLELLDSLKKVHKGNLDVSVLVVDNYPQDPIKINEKEYEDIKLKVIFSDENRGFTGGNNLGMEYAVKNGADYIIILNNDTIVDADFIENLVNASEIKGDGIYVPKIYFAKGYEFHKEKYKKSELGKVIWYAGGILDWRNVYGKHRGVDEVDHGQFDEMQVTDFATGCCFLITKGALAKVGMFDDKYFLYYEDADLSVRAKKAGFRIYYVPSSVIWHKNAGSTGGSGSALQDYYMSRNRLYLGMKYAPVRAKIALLREGAKLLILGRRGQKQGVLDYLFGRMGRSKRFR
jgi:GT2 family glycosyltransferase